MRSLSSKLLRFFVKCLIVASSYGLNNFTFGGLFAVYDTNGVLDKMQLECALAFRMAVDDINNQSDLLPTSFIDVAVRGGSDYIAAATSSLELAHLSLSNNGNETPPIGIVGSLASDPTLIVNGILASAKIVHMQSFANETAAEDRFYSFPFQAQVNPEEAYQGMVIQHMLCHNFSAPKVIVIHSANRFGTRAMLELRNGHFCPITLSKRYSLSIYRTDFSQFLLEAFDSLVMTYAIFMPPKSTALILEQGYRLGVFRTGSQVFGGSTARFSDIVKYFSVDANIPVIMKGFIAAEYWPQGAFFTPGGRAFVNAWRSQECISDCLSITDATGSAYLSYIPSGSNISYCPIVNFTDYNEYGSDLSPYAALTYDATYSLAFALHALIESNATINTANLMSALTNNVTINGVTGLVDFDRGTSSDGYYFHGQRTVSNSYRIVNFQEEAFLETGGNESFVPVNIWSEESGMQDCYLDMNCSEIIYKTLNNTKPTGLPPLANVDPPKVFRIGGIFSIFGNSSSNLAQAENLAAFLMAVQEINDKTDGLWDDVLPTSSLVAAVNNAVDFESAAHAAFYMSEAFGEKGVHGIVSAMENFETRITERSSGERGVVQINAQASDSDFGSRNLFPFNVQMVPVEAFQGEVIEQLLCGYFKSRKVSVFYEDTKFGVDSYHHLTDGSYCQIEVLSAHFFDPNRSDFTVILSEAASTGSNYFVFLAGAEITAELVYQGFTMGYFGQGKQLIGTSTAAAAFQFLSDVAEAVKMFKGFVYVDYWPTFSYGRAESAIGFMKRWRKRPSTLGTIAVSGTLQCFGKLDDNKQFRLYESPNLEYCAGVNFSSYPEDGSTMSSYAALTYDATIALAKGLHSSYFNNSDLSGSGIKKAMVESVQFEGVSGHVDFQDTPSLCEDCRNNGYRYRLLNFNEEAYYESENLSFVQVGYWSSSDGFQSCTPDMSCRSLMLNSRDNNLIPDAPPVIVENLSHELWIVIIVLAGITFLLVTGFAIILGYHRNFKIIRLSQPVMLCFIIAGEYLAIGRVLTTIFPVTDGSCIATMWFGHMAFVCVFGAVLIKTWRIDRLVNLQTLKRVRITARDVFVLMVGLTMATVTYLLVLTFVAIPHKAIVSDTVANQTTEVAVCNMRNPQMLTALYVVEAIIVLWGGRLCYAIRHVADMVNESKYIASVSIIILVLCATVFPIVTFFRLSPVVAEFLVSISFVFAVWTSTTILFAPKLRMLYAGDQLFSDLSTPRQPVVSEQPRLFSVNKKASEIVPDIEDMPTTAVLAAEAALRGKSKDVQIAICVEQIARWRQILLHLNEEEDSSPKNSFLNSNGGGSAQLKLSESQVGASASNANNKVSIELAERGEARRSSYENQSGVVEEISGIDKTTGTGSRFRLFGGLLPARVPLYSSAGYKSVNSISKAPAGGDNEESPPIPNDDENSTMDDHRPHGWTNFQQQQPALTTATTGVHAHSDKEHDHVIKHIENSSTTATASITETTTATSTTGISNSSSTTSHLISRIAEEDSGDKHSTESSNRHTLREFQHEPMSSLEEEMTTTYKS